MTPAPIRRAFVAGHLGLAGAAIARRLRASGVDVISRPRQALDLQVAVDVAAFMQRERPDAVFLAAARVGGIVANSEQPADFLHANLAIQTNVIHESWRAGVRRLVFLGSSCIYPRNAAVPIREESLLTGPLERTNEAYAVAKISGIAMCQAYSRQYGCDFRSVMPANLYGPGDNYDLPSGHFLASILRKCHLARLCESGNEIGVNEDEIKYGPIPESVASSLGLRREEAGWRLVRDRPATIELWGSGTPLREYLFVDDLAEACELVNSLSRTEFLRACPCVDGRQLEFLNIGSGEEKSIADLAALVREVVGATAPFSLDPTKPDGTPRKGLDSSRIRAFGWAPRTRLGDGITAAYRAYLA